MPRLANLFSTINGKQFTNFVLSYLKTNNNTANVILYDVGTPFVSSITQHLGIPSIVVSPKIVPVGGCTSYVPMSMFSQELDFFHRVGNYFTCHIIHAVASYLLDNLEIIHELSLPRPQVSKDIMLVSSQFGIETPQYIPPNVKLIGPTISKTRQAPNEELNKVDTPPNVVFVKQALHILLAFG